MAVFDLTSSLLTRVKSNEKGRKVHPSKVKGPSKSLSPKTLERDLFRQQMSMSFEMNDTINEIMQKVQKLKGRHAQQLQEAEVKDYELEKSAQAKRAAEEVRVGPSS